MGRRHLRQYEASAQAVINGRSASRRKARISVCPRGSTGIPECASDSQGLPTMRSADPLPNDQLLRTKNPNLILLTGQSHRLARTNRAESPMPRLLEVPGGPTGGHRRSREELRRVCRHVRSGSHCFTCSDWRTGSDLGVQAQPGRVLDERENEELWPRVPESGNTH